MKELIEKWRREAEAAEAQAAKNADVFGNTLVCELEERARVLRRCAEELEAEPIANSR